MRFLQEPSPSNRINAYYIRLSRIKSFWMPGGIFTGYVSRLVLLFAETSRNPAGIFLGTGTHFTVVLSPKEEPREPDHVHAPAADYEDHRRFSRDDE